MHSYIRPGQYVAIRLQSDQLRLIQIIPDTIVNLGRFGSFTANQIIGRPFYFTFEILDACDDAGHQLRVVSATELHAETLLAGEGDGEGDDVETGENGIPMRTNREIIDENSSQKLTLEEIEELKREAGGAGKDIVAKLLESHSAIDQKTAFSLAKYTLRKRKKYLKRFTVLPLDVGLLANYLIEERDAQKAMELRDEHIGLIGCWGNVHHSGNVEVGEGMKPHGRYAIVDETGGLVVAAMAERMGILYPHDADEDPVEEQDASAHNAAESQHTNSPPKPRRIRPQPMSATTNTITVIHPYSQPNLSLLKFFGYDTNNPDESHPLHTRLKSISWMQLADPNSDPLYANEPPIIPAEELAELKQSKRTAYYHKRNRWARVKAVVDEARDGNFDGLIVSTLLEPASVLRTMVPLLAGSAPVVVYSPTVESLVELTDMYSTARRTAFINKKRELESQSSEGEAVDLSSLHEEFVVDPTILLPPTLQTSRVRPWQVLPGRTHPLMTGRGGAEGYLFHGIRVLPTAQNIQAAGNVRKRRKVETASTPVSDRDVEMTS